MLAMQDAAFFRTLNEVGVISQLSYSVFKRILPDGITLPQFIVLNHFSQTGQKHMPSELAQTFQVAKASMANTLRKLETKGLIETVPDISDRRCKRIGITPDGVRMHELCLRRLSPKLNRFSNRYPASRMHILLPDLIQLRDWLGSIA